LHINVTIYIKSQTFYSKKEYDYINIRIYVYYNLLRMYDYVMTSSTRIHDKEKKDGYDLILLYYSYSQMKHTHI